MATKRESQARVPHLLYLQGDGWKDDHEEVVFLTPSERRRVEEELDKCIKAEELGKDSGVWKFRPVRYERSLGHALEVINEFLTSFETRS